MLKKTKKTVRKCTQQVAYTLGWTCCGSNSSAFSNRGSDSDTDSDAEDEGQKFVEIDLLRPDLNAARKFPNNSIRTAKYTLFSGLPLSLLYQFHKVSNVYFLLVMVVSLVPGASPINPFSSIAPLCVVLGAGIIKDLWEDWKRRKADKAANEKVVHVLRGNEFLPVKSYEVRPGDVMLFRLGEEVKADCLILNTSLPDGLTYIETANLDGETNAKTRRAKIQTVELLGTVEDINEVALGAAAHLSSAAASGLGPSKVAVGGKSCCSCGSGGEKKAAGPVIVAVDDGSSAAVRHAAAAGDGGEQPVKRLSGLDQKGNNAADACNDGRASRYEQAMQLHRPSLSADGTVELVDDDDVDNPRGGRWRTPRDGEASGGGEAKPTREEYEARRRSSRTPANAHHHQHARSHSAGEALGHVPGHPRGSRGVSRVGSLSELYGANASGTSGGYHHSRYQTLDERMEQEGVLPQEIMEMSRRYEQSASVHPHGGSHGRFTTPLLLSLGVGGGGDARGERDAQEASGVGHPNMGSAAAASSGGDLQSAHKDGDLGLLPPPTPAGMERGGVVILGSAPSPDLSSWYGQVRVAATEEMIPVGIDQFLPRGCIVRNTDWVLGAVLYTGKNTKMLLNLRPKPNKTTRMTRRLNQLNVFLFVLNQVLMFLLCGLAVWFTRKLRAKPAGLKTDWTHWYLEWNLQRYSDVKLFWWRYLTNFVLLSYLIPMSLYVTLEFNKAMQMLMIGSDKRMAVFDEFTGKLRKSRPKTSELNCQLGQVEYIFTDKTGTLTENLMTYVGGFAAGIRHDEREKPGGMGKLFYRKAGGGGGGGVAHGASGQGTSGVFYPHAVLSLDEADNSVNRATANYTSGLNRYNSGDGAILLQPATSLNNVVRPPPNHPHQNSISINVDAAAFTPSPQLPAVQSSGNLSLSPHSHHHHHARTQTLGKFEENALEDDDLFRYLRAMALCHSVVCFDVNDDDGDGDAEALAKKKKKKKGHAEGGPRKNGQKRKHKRAHEHRHAHEPVEDVAVTQETPPAEAAAAPARSLSGRTLPRPTRSTSKLSDGGANVNPELISLGRSSNRFFHVPNAVPSGPNVDDELALSRLAASTKVTHPQGADTRTTSPFSSPSDGVDVGAGGAAATTGPEHYYHARQASRQSQGPGSTPRRVLSGTGKHSAPRTSKAGEGLDGLEHSRTYSVSKMLHGRTGSASWYVNRYTANATQHQRSGTAFSATGAGGVGIGVGAVGGASGLEEYIDRSKIYEGQSLDEIALVSAARENGFTLFQRTAKQMFIKVMGKVLCYDIIAELEFTPQRKLMSILLHRNPLGDSEDAAASAAAGGNAHYHRITDGGNHGDGGQVGRGLNLSASFTASSDSTSSSSPTAADHAAPHTGRSPFEPSHADGAGENSAFHESEEHGQPMPRRDTLTFEDDQRAKSKLKSNDLSLSGVPQAPPGPLSHQAVSVAENAKHFGSPTTTGDSSANTTTMDANNSGPLVGSSPGAGAGPVGSMPLSYSAQRGVGSEFAGVAAPPSSSPPPYLLLVKGADSSMMDIINPRHPQNAAMKPVFLKQLDEMASQGLRTLVLGQKYLTEQEVRTWLPIYNEAQCAMSQRSERLHEAYALLERDIDLIGTTAVEDKLQDGVPETLEFMSEAGIVVWMLTGDKRETAVTIALTSGLVDTRHEDFVCHLDIADLIAEETTMKHVAEGSASGGAGADPDTSSSGNTNCNNKANGKEKESPPRRDRSASASPLLGQSSLGPTPLYAEKCRLLDEQLTAAEQRCSEAEAAAEAFNSKNGNDHGANYPDYHDAGGSGEGAVSSKITVIVVDGKTLDFIFQDNARAHRFFLLGSRCRSAVCCRMTPLQKAQIVHMFQKNMNAVALAIGDGANDVSMIQESKIGVGIMGLEGSQAELASDYAIPKFRFLKRLLMVHGRFSIFRDAHCIVYSLYKNVVLTVGMISYTFYSAYSGQAFIDSWLLAMFSVFFCSLQPLMIGILDKDVEDELAETLPQLYPPLSRENMYFSFPYIIKWMVDGAVEGFFFFFFVIYTCALKDDLYRAKSGGIEDYGQTFFTMLVLVVDLRVGVLVTYYMILFAIAIFLEIGMLPAIQLIYGEIHNLAGSNWCVYVAHALYGCGKFYLFLFFAVGVLVVYTLSTSLYIQMFYPWQNAGLAMMAAKRSPYRRLHKQERRELKAEYRRRVAAFLSAEKANAADEQHDQSRFDRSQPHPNATTAEHEIGATEMTRRPAKSDGKRGRTRKATVHSPHEADESRVTSLQREPTTL